MLIKVFIIIIKSVSVWLRSMQQSYSQYKPFNYSFEIVILFAMTYGNCLHIRRPRLCVADSFGSIFQDCCLSHVEILVVLHSSYILHHRNKKRVFISKIYKHVWYYMNLPCYVGFLVNKIHWFIKVYHYLLSTATTIDKVTSDCVHCYLDTVYM